MITRYHAWLPIRIWNLAEQGRNPTAVRPPDAIRPRSILSDTYPSHFHHGGCIILAHQLRSMNFPDTCIL